MGLQTMITQEARWPSDPAVMETGAGSLTGADRMARSLGWFSLALGLTQLTSARAIARGLGIEGKEPLIWAAGARGVASGIACLSTEKSCGIWSRIAGGVLDIAVLSPAYRDDNPKKPNVALALTALMQRDRALELWEGSAPAPVASPSLTGSNQPGTLPMSG